MKERLLQLILILSALCTVVGTIAFWLFVGYVAYHFITKYW